MRALLTLAVAITLSGCAEMSKIEQIYTVATTTTVPAEIVRPTANAFDILKGTAANFAQFCVQENFTPMGCDVSTRRLISRAIKSGTMARVQLRASLSTGQPALSTVYNLLVGAVNDLKASPVNSFTGAK